MSDLTTGRFSAALTSVEQPLPAVETDRPVAERETPRETTAAELRTRPRQCRRKSTCCWGGRVTKACRVSDACGCKVVWHAEHPGVDLD